MCQAAFVTILKTMKWNLDWLILPGVNECISTEISLICLCFSLTAPQVEADEVIMLGSMCELMIKWPLIYLVFWKGCDL